MDKCRINIAIAEPSQIIREGLSNILLQKGNVQYNFYHFDRIEEITDESPMGLPEVVIANPALIKNGLKGFQNFRNAHPGILWVAILYSFSEREIIALFDAVIQITDPPGTIAATIHKLASTNCRNTNAGHQDQLTARETEVLKLLVKGLSNKEIAGQLNISTHTVISHRKNIAQKTGIKSQAGLTIFAISSKIIDIDDFQG